MFCSFTCTQCLTYASFAIRSKHSLLPQHLVELTRCFPSRNAIGITSFVGSIVAIVYFSRLEIWRSWHMSWFLLLYWMASLATMGIQMGYLIYQDNEYNTNLVDVHVTIFDITIIMIAIYSFLLLIELYFIFTMVGHLYMFITIVLTFPDIKRLTDKKSSTNKS